MNNVSLKPSFSVLSIMGLVMLLTGTLTTWAVSPLGASHRLFEIFFSAWDTGTFGAMFVLATFSYVLFSALGLPRIALGAVLVMLTLLILFFAVFGLSDHPWLIAFLNESDQRTNLETLFRKDYWPNISPEPTIVLINDFEYLSDRIVLFWHVAAFGSSVSCAGTIFLLIRSGFVLPKQTAMSLFFGILILGALAARSPLLAAELEHRRGDSYLDRGQYVQAIESYQSAIELDPVLRHSRAFTVKSSYAFLKQEGSESLFARLAAASTQPVLDSEVSTGIESVYATYRNLAEADFHNAGSSLQQAILAQTRKEAMRTLVNLGLILRASDRPNSIAALQKELEREPTQSDALVLLAHSEIKLGLWSNAISHLATALESIENRNCRANVLCTLGDAYQAGGEFLQAREAYLDCEKADDFKNFRVTRNLGGT